MSDRCQELAAVDGWVNRISGSLSSPAVAAALRGAKFPLVAVARIGRAVSPHPLFGLLAAAVAGVELGLLALHPRGFWHAVSLPWSARVGLAVLVLLTWASLAWIAWWCWAWWAIARPAGKSRWWVHAVQIAFAAAGAGISALFVASWVFFWRAGVFLDHEALRFGATNAEMIGKYLWQSERAAVYGLAAILVAGPILLVTIGWPGLAPREPEGSVRGAWWMGIIPLLAALNLSAWLIELHSSPSVSGDHRERFQQWWETDGERFEYVLRYRVNPVLTLIWSPLIVVEQPIEGTLTEEQLGPRRSNRHLVQRASGSGARRSLIVIAVEALRHDVIGMQHQGREIMPHVNGLARGGVHFTNAYSQSTHSDYADPCIVSSLYPLRTRGHHYYSRSDPWPKVLIYDVLKQHGYATAIISSQNEGWGRMDQFLASPHLDLFFDSRDYDGETFVCDRDPGFARFVKGARVAGKLDDRITIQKVIGWIGEQQAADVPFFVSVNLQTSHFPYEIPGGRTGPFQPAMMDFPASFVSYPREKVPVVRNAYYNALHYIDQQIGRLVSFLDETGLRDETLLVIAGDNGEAFYENGHPTHAGPPYEPAIRVGLLMHCPAVLTPATETYLMQLIDVAPTALALLGIAPHPCFQGIDVLAADRPANEARVVLVHCESALSGSDAVVSGTGWKYVEDRRSGQRRLHQLGTDPGEERNLGDTYPEVTRVLQRVMHQWRQRQLLYYQTPAYYGWYWPPRTPMVSAEDVERLIAFRVVEEEACLAAEAAR